MNTEKSSGQKQRPEAVAEFAETARHESSSKDPKDMTADEHTAPIPVDNEVKHDVAEKILNAGAHGEKIDIEETVEPIPDRVIESR
jgi:uncharacterized protein YqeY